MKRSLPNVDPSGQPMKKRRQLHPSVESKLESLENVGLRRDEISLDILDSLAQFEPNIGCEILDVMSGKNISTIQNKSGFLAGIMKKYRERIAAGHINPYMSRGHAGSQRGSVKDIPPETMAKLEELYSAGKIQPNELDEKILNSLSTFPYDTQLEILDKFASADHTTVRNKNGFIAGIMRKYRNGGIPPQQGFMGNGQMMMSRQQQPAHQQRSMNLNHRQFIPHHSICRQLDALYSAGFLLPGEFDAETLAMFGEVDEATALDALVKFQTSPLVTQVNKSGFMQGILRKAKQQSYSMYGQPSGYNSGYGQQQQVYGSPSFPPPQSSLGLGGVVGQSQGLDPQAFATWSALGMLGGQFQ